MNCLNHAALIVIVLALLSELPGVNAFLTTISKEDQ
jgi:hypothetical protein